MSDDPDQPTNDPLVGQVIQERFRIDKKLGQGGMGAIYLAEHLLLKKKVALKCLHAGLASNPDVVRRFKNEAVAASSIGHPNIVDVMDMGRFDDGTFFMVLEFLDGRDWQDDLDREGAEPVSKVAHIGMQVCAALGAAAAKGIVHRDLKPENIFLTTRHGDDNFVKVLDFGISKIHDGTGGATKTGELMGTPYYMAPEQVMGEKDITHLADVYALGVIFFQALSGKVPFDGNTLAQILLKIASEPPPTLEGTSLPREVVELVSQMLDKNPSARPQSFDEVAERLVPFLSDQSRFSGNIVPGASLGAALSGFGRTQLPNAAAAQTGYSGAPTTSGGTDSGKKSLLAIGGASLLVGAIVVWFVAGSDSDGEVAETTSNSAELIEPATDPSTEEGKPEAPPVETVRVQISTEPSDAEIILDGKPVNNPFDGDLAKDEKSHELIVSRAGYTTDTRQIVLTASQRIVVPLTPKAATTKKPAPQPAAKPAPRSASSEAPSPSPSPRPSSGKSNNPTPKPIRDLERSIKKLF